MLEHLQHNFTVALSADFQMQKLVLLSPQPGSTYYLQKLSHDIFGIVDHRQGHSILYIFDKTVGPKNTDHTISLLMDYMRNSTDFPSWIRHVHIFPGSTNKNAYFMGWGMETVQVNPYVFHFLWLAILNLMLMECFQLLPRHSILLMCSIPVSL